MKKLLTFSLLTLLVSCGSTKIVKKIERPALGPKAKIEVYSKNAPSFGYNVICEATVKAMGNFTSTNLSGYEGSAKRIARKCGANIAIVKSLSGYTNNVTVTILAVERNSDESKMAKMEKEISKLSSAFYVGNLENTKLILKKFEMSKDIKKRSPHDSKLLELMMLNAAEMGKNCPTNTMAYLNKEYNILIKNFSDFSAEGRYSVSKKRVKLEKVLNCKSKVIVKSFPSIKDSDKAIANLNNTMSKGFNGGYISKTQKINFKNLYKDLMVKVNASCDKDKLSSVCSLKSNLQRIYKVSNK